MTQDEMDLVARYVTNTLSALLDPDIRRLNETIADLIKRNNTRTGRTTNCLKYMGTCLPARPTGTKLADIPKVDDSLILDLEIWIEDSNKIRSDQTVLRQSLFTLFKGCKEEQDIRDTLPECVVPLVHGLSTFPRTRETAYTLKSDERVYRLFMEGAIPKMELYASLRFFF